MRVLLVGQRFSRDRQICAVPKWIVPLKVHGIYAGPGRSARTAGGRPEPRAGEGGSCTVAIDGHGTTTPVLGTEVDLGSQNGARGAGEGGSCTVAIDGHGTTTSLRRGGSCTKI